ncbi:MAG: 4Fe-4S binding protein [Ignavibacteriales bacterium]|nr:4Fe-4S binding protein [Ignavibacteriales bacterium]
MKDEIFQRLAQKLDELPNRFPQTQNGVEYRMLAKIFAPEEAVLACAMNLESETGAVIANRAGIDPREARDTLKRMVAKGLIDLRKGEGEFAYALRPFIVGFYEGQLPRMDKEMAELFEQYFRETQGGVLRPTPALHRVIPVGRAIPLKVNIDPYEQANAMLEKAQSWGVRDCICRKQQLLLGKECHHKLETCLVFASLKNAFDRSKVDRAITKEEALKILWETEEAGLVHSSGNYRDGVEYICNCCTCCCGIMRGIAEYGILSAVAHSDFQIALEEEKCSLCGVCIDRCQFHALSIPDAILAVDIKHCFGCGLCVLVCPTEALHLKRRESDQILIPPADKSEWQTQRNLSKVR